MSRYSLSHLSDPALLHELKSLVAQDRATTATLLAHLAEVDARKLYLPAACPSMYDYCVRELKFSEDAAFKRIRAARTARRFPAVFALVAEGRLHLSAIVLLTPYLTATNADELLAAAADQSKAALEQWLAGRFPRTEMLEWLEPVPAQKPLVAQLAPGPFKMETGAPGTGTASADVALQLAPGPVIPYVVPPTSAPAPAVDMRAQVKPVAPERFALQVMIGQGTRDKLRHAQELLGHAVPSGEVAEVLDRALDALIHQLERRKFAATDKPRPRRGRSSANPRHIPAVVKRAVWERDGGQCTFVSEDGHRCPARTRLEFDHVLEVARGGRASVAGIRLRCRAHNQFTAERTFGAGFMEQKRERAREAATPRTRATATTAATRAREAAALTMPRAGLAAAAELARERRARAVPVTAGASVRASADRPSHRPAP